MMTTEAKLGKFGDRWLTVKEAAEYTRTDEDWILAHIKSGALKFVPTARRVSASPKGPKRRIIDRLKLDALMERLEIDEKVPVVRPATDTSAAKKVRPPAATRGMSLKERRRLGL
jgi:excisionase family DNA binding protein